jgi:hypothetical protein
MNWTDDIWIFSPRRYFVSNCSKMVYTCQISLMMQAERQAKLNRSPDEHLCCAPGGSGWSKMTLFISMSGGQAFWLLPADFDYTHFAMIYGANPAIEQ